MFILSTKQYDLYGDGSLYGYCYGNDGYGDGMFYGDTYGNSSYAVEANVDEMLRFQPWLLLAVPLDRSELTSIPYVFIKS